MPKPVANLTNAVADPSLDRRRCPPEAGTSAPERLVQAAGFPKAHPQAD
jgi:hypothetical protein